MACCLAWVQCSASVHSVYPLLSAGLVIPVACPIHSMLWSGPSWNKASAWMSLLFLTLWLVYMNQIWELMPVNFPSETQCPCFTSGCCMPLSKCWLLLAKFGVPTVCIKGSCWSLGLKVKAKLDSKHMPCYNREQFYRKLLDSHVWHKPECDLKCLCGCFLESAGHKITLECLRQNLHVCECMCT